MGNGRTALSITSDRDVLNHHLQIKSVNGRANGCGGGAPKRDSLAAQRAPVPPFPSSGGHPGSSGSDRHVAPDLRRLSRGLLRTIPQALAFLRELSTWDPTTRASATKNMSEAMAFACGGMPRKLAAQTNFGKVVKADPELKCVMM